MTIIRLPTLHKKQTTTPVSIRHRLVFTLLMGLPILFLLIAIAVSIPLYQQIFRDSDESMQQFSQLILNDRTVQKTSQKSTIDNPDRRTDSLDERKTNDEKITKDMIFAESFEMAIWNQSGKLIENSQLDMKMINHIKHSENPADAESIFSQIDIRHVSQGFYDTAHFFSSNAWRLYITTHPETGETIAVAQPLQERMANIKGFIKKQMLMLFFSLPLLISMVIWAVHSGLRPLSILANTVQQRHANDLSPISDSVPKELQPLTHSLNQLLTKVSDSIDRQKQFSADASHELKTPIAAIKVQASELQHRLQQALVSHADNSNCNQYFFESLQSVQRIQKIADRSAHLMEQLLILTKLDNDSLSNHTNNIEKHPINWLPISEQALQCVSRIARDNGVKLERHIQAKNADDILPLTNGGNQALLILMLKNLLDNAIRYGVSGEPIENKKVEITLAENNIIIRDYGSGIPEQYLQRIHERFFRPAGQTQTGSGLGLSIVNKVAELHGLQVIFKNHQQGGLIAQVVSTVT